jgi:phage terminase small subunit
MKNIATLSARESAFVASFLASGNATSSAIAANFSPKGASVAGNRMLRNARVQEALKARQAADAARLSMKREDVLVGLLEAVNQAREQKNPMAMISGLRELGRMMGFYAVETRRVELAVDGQGALSRLERMTDGELLQIIAAGRDV